MKSAHLHCLKNPTNIVLVEVLEVHKPLCVEAYTKDLDGLIRVKHLSYAYEATLRCL